MPMDTIRLREALITQLWRMNKMNIITYLREFIEGEAAALWYLKTTREEVVIPSMISENLRVSRARTAIILRALREKGYVMMEIEPTDRRKMAVRLTEEGRRFIDDKYAFLLRYFDRYIAVLGEEHISKLTELLRQTADHEQDLADWSENRAVQSTKEEKNDR